MGISFNSYMPTNAALGMLNPYTCKISGSAVRTQTTSRFCLMRTMHAKKISAETAALVNCYSGAAYDTEVLEKVLRGQHFPSARRVTYRFVSVFNY